LCKSEYDELAAHLCNARQSSCYIFTAAHRQAYLSKLAVESYSETELRDYYNAFNACHEPEVGQPMLDGIRALHESLHQIDNESVILFEIG
jgi:hypothetical protein